MPGTDILIIDDEPQMRQMLTRLLTSEGYKTESAEAAKKGLKFLEAHEVFLVLCDVKLPDGRGTEITLQLKKMYPETEIILFTAYGNISDGVLAIKNGAFDYLVKGDDNTKIIPLVGRAVEKAKLQFKIKHLQEKFSDGYTFESLIGHSKELKAVKEAAVKVAPTDTTGVTYRRNGNG